MTSHSLKLSIHATPGAKRTEPAGAYGDALRVRLGAPPVDGKANTALIEWASNAFGVAKSRVDLLHGAAGRQKVLAIAFESSEQLARAQQQIADWMKL